ncbi:Myb/SANT-like domain, harbinger transposase-derived nuclease domain protein [Tanacetum coccineum]|uniref:Myb/SANT-like domain, harbinger transposase-derived nuclease domain protein n=1 Tax=Tanacetum coccineum TaxID=301880 RepID=A0ABQ4Y4S5_9ASTR
MSLGKMMVLLPSDGCHGVIRCQNVMAMEGGSGLGGMVNVNGFWNGPKFSQVLRVFREQGLIFTGLLGLSAFFSMAETSNYSFALEGTPADCTSSGISKARTSLILVGDKCIEEMNSTGMNGTSLHKQSWARLGRVFKEKFNIDFNQKDIKNGFDNLKAKYVGWLYLKNKTGNLYNPDTKMFNLTQEEWEDFKKIHKRAASLQSKPLPYSDLCEIVFQSISANGDGQWTNTEIRASASVSAASASGPSASEASASGASASGASVIRERVGALNMDDDPLVDVVVHDDDDDDGNSRAHKINDEVRPKKKAKTFRVTMDDLMVDMQSALRHIVGTTDGPTTEQCYEKLKLVGLRSTDPVFLVAFNIFGQSRQMREAWMTLPSEPDVLKGWIELTGVAHDSRILSEAIRNQNAPFPLPPPDKYYLCDAAYAHTRGFMAPYRNVRYWLGDFRRRRPLNGKEKFNHSHAKLRNVIERAYGVLKARFPILKRMAPFSLTTQRNITIACFALHNFIRKEGLNDELFSTYDELNVQLDNENVLVEDDGGVEEDQVVQPQGNASDREYMTNLRDQIAQQLMQSG